MTARFCALCKRTLVDGQWRAYCPSCVPVANIVFGSADEAVRIHIPKLTDRDVLVRCVDLERAKPHARSSVITVLHRRIWKLGGGIA